MIIQESFDNNLSELEIYDRTAMIASGKDEGFLSGGFPVDSPIYQNPLNQRPCSYGSHSGSDNVTSGRISSDFVSASYRNGTVQQQPCFPLGAAKELGKSTDLWQGNSSAGAYRPNFTNSSPRYAAYQRFNQNEVPDTAPRKTTTRESTNTLKTWLQEHNKNPYPTKGEKIMLAIITKMTLTQVSTWFANARRRLKKENKMTWHPKNRSGELSNQLDDNKKSEEEDISSEETLTESCSTDLEDLNGHKPLFEPEPINRLPSMLSSFSNNCLPRPDMCQNIKSNSIPAFSKYNDGYTLRHMAEYNQSACRRNIFRRGYHENGLSDDNSRLYYEPSAGMNDSLCSRTKHAQSTHCNWSTASQVYHPGPSDNVAQSHMRHYQVPGDNNRFTENSFPPYQVNHHSQNASSHFPSFNQFDLSNPIPSTPTDSLRSQISAPTHFNSFPTKNQSVPPSGYSVSSNESYSSIPSTNPDLHCHPHQASRLNGEVPNSITTEAPIKNFAFTNSPTCYEMQSTASLSPNSMHSSISQFNSVGEPSYANAEAAKAASSLAVSPSSMQHPINYSNYQPSECSTFDRNFLSASRLNEDLKLMTPSPTSVNPMSKFDIRSCSRQETVA